MNIGERHRVTIRKIMNVVLFLTVPKCEVIPLINKYTLMYLYNVKCVITIKIKGGTSFDALC